MLRDKRRAEERLAAMKHQRLGTRIGQQQGHKQANGIQEDHVKVLPTAVKYSQQNKNTETLLLCLCLFVIVFVFEL